jgi:hypothetical protein
MTTIESTTTAVAGRVVSFEIDDAQLAAVSFLARYSGRTLEAYRHDLRGYFQWAADNLRRANGAQPEPRNADHRKFDYSGATVGELRDGLITRWTDYHDSAPLGL